MEKRTEKFARMLKVLSSGTRLQIILHLKDGLLCVNALAARLHVTQGAVSQHLRVMHDAGLVTAEKRGYYVHYRLDKKAFEKLLLEAQKLLSPETTGSPDRECVKKCGAENACSH